MAQERRKSIVLTIGTFLKSDPIEIPNSHWPPDYDIMVAGRYNGYLTDGDIEAGVMPTCGRLRFVPRKMLETSAFMDTMEYELDGDCIGK